METTDCILTRRSIRNFNDKEVSDDIITKIAKLAIYTPSWKNSQTVRYIIIRNKELKNKIANNCLNNFEWNKGIINSSNALVVEITINGISGYENDKTPTTSKGSHWQSFDAGLSAQTFCLAAHDFGVSSVILGIFDEAAIKKELEISDEYSVSSLIAIGYSDQTPVAPARIDIDDFLTII